MRLRASLVVLALVAAALPAQQAGDGNRNYVINGQGSLASSPVNSIIVDCNNCGQWVNSYATQDANAPVIWLTASQGNVGWIQTPTNSVDIGPANLTVLLDGADPLNPMAPFLTTDGNGKFLVQLSITATVAASNLYFAMGHVAPSSPDGWWISQTHNPTFDPPNQLAAGNFNILSGGNSLALGDDQGLPIPIGFTFPFYNGSYSSVWVNSNGILSFGGADIDWTEDPTDLVAGQPKICGWWDDLNPSNGGTIEWKQETNNTPFGTERLLKVVYNYVPDHYNTDIASFSITLSEFMTGITIRKIIMRYSQHLTGDGLVGIGPGLTIFPPTPVPLDFSAGGASGLSQATAYYEQFSLGLGNPEDLRGHRIEWFIHPNGQPDSVN